MAFGAGGAAGRYVVEFVGKVDGVKDAVKQVDGQVSTLGQKTSGMGRMVAGALATTAVIGFGKATVTAASEAEQSLGAMQSTFGDLSGEMEAFAETAASSFGLSAQQANQLAAVTGSLLKNTGMDMSEVADRTQALTGRAADLAATFGTDVESAMAAVNSALKGELDPLESFGVSLKASTIDAKAQAMGLVDAEGKVTAYGKAVAAQELIMEQSADKAGAFARESGTLAGQTAILKAEFANLSAEIGSALLPILVALLDALRPLFDFIAQNAGWLGPLVLGLGALVIVLQGVMFATTTLIPAVTILWGLLAANPIGLVVLAIVAVVAAVVIMYKKFDWFRNFIDGVIDWIANNWQLLVAILVGPIGLAVKLVIDNFDSIKRFVQRLIDWMRNAWSQVVQWLTAPIRQAASIISGLFNSIRTAFSGLISGIRGIASGAYEAIVGPFRRAIDAVKRMWDNTIGKLKMPKLPKVNIPFLAQGGIVTGPTLAVVGEAGPEAVVPLGQLGAFRRGAAAAGSAGDGAVVSYTVNVYALNANAETGRLVANSLREYERVTGRPA